MGIEILRKLYSRIHKIEEITEGLEEEGLKSEIRKILTILDKESDRQGIKFEDYK